MTTQGRVGELTPSVSLGNYSWNEVEIKNTPGSTAGSGSGDFHQYRMQRRKEIFRVQNIERQAKELEIDREFQSKMHDRREQEEAKTLKKSEKRKAKKVKQLQSKIRKKWEAALENAASETTDEGSEDKAKENTKDKTKDETSDKAKGDESVTSDPAQKVDKKSENQQGKN